MDYTNDSIINYIRSEVGCNEAQANAIYSIAYEYRYEKGHLDGYNSGYEDGHYDGYYVGKEEQMILE